MGRKSKPERKKLSMKTRLLIILLMFVLVNVIFFVGSEFSDNKTDEEQLEQESEITSKETTEEPQYAKFNPPLP